MINFTEITSFATQLADESGRVILAHYLDPHLRVERKVDETPVTQADREAEIRMREAMNHALD